MDTELYRKTQNHKIKPPRFEIFKSWGFLYKLVVETRIIAKIQLLEAFFITPLKHQ